MYDPHTKFEVSTITCNEEMTGNAKCKSLVLSQETMKLSFTVFET